MSKKEDALKQELKETKDQVGSSRRIPRRFRTVSTSCLQTLHVFMGYVEVWGSTSPKP
jgi:hypothetical protein